jgi:hypothetical protein
MLSTKRSTTFLPFYVSVRLVRVIVLDLTFFKLCTSTIIAVYHVNCASKVIEPGCLSERAFVIFESFPQHNRNW